VPGQSVENRVLIHIRYSLEDISHDIEKKKEKHTLSLSLKMTQLGIFTGWV
jgi:hypothetical protein